MRWALGRALPVLFAPLALTAQPSRGASCSAPMATAVTLPFRDVGRVITSMALSDTGRSAVLGVRSIDFASDGRVLITDSRQRRVMIFDSQLKGATSLGREGAGPGEFRTPRQALFGADGAVSVLDIALGRVVEFDRTGRFRRVVRMPTSDPRMIALLPGGDYLVAGNNLVGGQDRLLTRSDPDAKVVWVAVPTDSILRAIKLIVDGVWLVRSGDNEAIVGLAAAPTLSRVRLSDGAVTCRTAMPSSFWTQLTPANRPRQESLASMREWIEGATLVMAATRTTSGLLVITTKRGGVDAEVREWVVFDINLAPLARVSGVPGPAVATRGDTLVVVVEADDGRTTIQRVALTLPRAR